MAYVRKVKNGEKTAVQVVWKEHGEIVKLVHLGTVGTEKGIKKLLKEAEEILHTGQIRLFEEGTKGKIRTGKVKKAK